MCVSLVVLGGFVASAGAAPIITNLVRTAADTDAADTPPVVANNLQNGSVFFVDRTHIHANVPAILQGLEYVRFANDDKNFAGHRVNITVGQACTMYLLIDNRLGDDARANPPTMTSPDVAWVAQLGFVQTDITTEIDESANGSIDQTFTAFKGTFAAGTYTLGGMISGYGGNMYSLAVAPPATQAANPVPANGSQIGATTVALSWTPGAFAAQHHVYLSSNQADVVNRAAGADKGLVTFAIYPATGLVAGTTYYWAIDEVNNTHPDSPWAGPVWSFTVIPVKAWNPRPVDGAANQPSNVTLQWNRGLDAIQDLLFWGTNYDTVLNSTTPQASPTTPSYALTGLPNQANIYWRIDTVNSLGQTTKGDVWTFGTAPNIPVTDPNLLVWYTFEEGSGNVALDYSGHNRHGVMTGSPLPSRTGGMVGDAIALTGNGDRIVYDGDNGAFLNGLSAMSVTVWIKSNIINTEKGFVVFTDPDGTDARDIRYDDAGSTTGVDNCFKYGVTTGTAGQQLESPGGLQVTEWQHVAMTWVTDTQIQFYVDGTLLAPGNPPADPPDGTTIGCTKLVVGQGCKDGAASSWNGLIDDVRVYNKALTQQQIKDIMRGDPKLAWNPKPGNRASVDVETGRAISWSPGDTAAMHDVYFSTDKAAVDTATTSTAGVYVGRQGPNTFDPGALAFGGTYYWRIDEVETGGTVIHKGYTWTFTTLSYLNLEDFESYGDSTVVGAPGSRMWYTWKDGYGWTDPTTVGGNGTGSLVGNWPPPVAERTVIHGGKQSMPFWYDNSGTGTDALGNPITAKYSETERTLAAPQNFTRNGVRALSLWFQGVSPMQGGMVVNGNQITVTGAGADIWGTSDQFHFANKAINQTQFTLVVRVESVQNTNGWAKAGIMIRDTLAADSANCFLAVTPANGITAQIRSLAGATSANTAVAGLTAPYWIRLARDSFGDVTAAYSADNSTWTTLATDNLGVTTPLYIGLAVTSHVAGTPCTAVFSSFTMDGGAVTGLTNQDIGIVSNTPAPLYMALTDSLGNKRYVTNPDAGAVNRTAWTQWNIDLASFQTGGFNLNSVSKVAIGVGTPTSTTPGGAGKMYFDDIALYPPRYIPGLGTPLSADLNANGVVDLADTKILVDDWLKQDFTAPALVAWYKLDGNALDSSGSGFHADPCSDPGARFPTYVASKAGLSQAVDVNGGGDYLVARNVGARLNGVDALTVAVWIKADVIGTDKGFIDFQVPNGNDSRDMRFDVAGGSGGGTNVFKVGITATDGEQKIEGSNGMQKTDWQHVAMTWASGKNLTLYLDGVPDTPTYIEPIRYGTLTGYGPMHIGKGCKDNAANLSWAGLIDEVRVYDKALSQAELQSIMAGGAGTVSDYHPLNARGELYSGEAQNSRVVNFKDLAVMLGQWMQRQLWPEW